MPPRLGPEHIEASNEDDALDESTLDAFDDGMPPLIPFHMPRRWSIDSSDDDTDSYSSMPGLLSRRQDSSDDDSVPELGRQDSSDDDSVPELGGRRQDSSDDDSVPELGGRRQDSSDDDSDTDVIHANNNAPAQRVTTTAPPFRHRDTAEQLAFVDAIVRDTERLHQNRERVLMEFERIHTAMQELRFAFQPALRLEPFPIDHLGAPEDENTNSQQEDDSSEDLEEEEDSGDEADSSDEEDSDSEPQDDSGASAVDE